MKRKQRWKIDTDAVWQSFSHHIGQMRLAGKVPVVEIVPEHRSLDQNAMSFALYQQIASQKEDESIEDVRRRCKLEHGVPILRRDDDEFQFVYDNSIKKLPYEHKIIAMKWTDVTSRMNKSQFSEYLDEVIRHHSMQGISLTHPSEQYG